MNCCKNKDKTHATQMFKTLTNTLHGDVLYEVFTILFCFILLWFILFYLYDLFTEIKLWGDIDIWFAS
jgi:hypothetical protein